jgi:hypothetical protein
LGLKSPGLKCPSTHTGTFEKNISLPRGGKGMIDMLQVGTKLKKTMKINIFLANQSYRLKIFMHFFLFLITLPPLGMPG